MFGILYGWVTEPFLSNKKLKICWPSESINHHPLAYDHEGAIQVCRQWEATQHGLGRSTFTSGHTKGPPGAGLRAGRELGALGSGCNIFA